MSTVHIHAPHGVYIGQRCRRGARTWEDATESQDDMHTALILLAGAMKGFHRGRVIFCTEWYAPNIVAEIKA